LPLVADATLQLFQVRNGRLLVTLEFRREPEQNVPWLGLRLVCQGTFGAIVGQPSRVN